MLIAAICFHISTSYAQTPKDIKAAVESLKKIKTDLEKNCNTLRKEISDLEHSIDTLESNRKSILTKNENYFKKKIEEVSSGLLLDEDNIEPLKRELEKFKKNGESWTKPYELLLEMNKSLYKPYTKQIDTFKTQVKELPKVDALTERVSAGINIFRFSIYEVARVIKLINKSKTTPSFEQLKREQELTHIIKVPYSTSLLKDYITSKGQNSKNRDGFTPDAIIDIIKKQIPDAFDD